MKKKLKMKLSLSVWKVIYYVYDILLIYIQNTMHTLIIYPSFLIRYETA